MLTREQLLNRRTKTATVPADELGDGETLNVRLLSAAQFMRLSNDAKLNPELGYAHWLVATVCDGDGKPLFGADDLDAAAGLPFPLVTRLIDAAQKLNGTATASGPNA